MTQIAADTLGLPPENATFMLGDSSLPDAPVEGGSFTVSSVGSAVKAALPETSQTCPRLDVSSSRSGTTASSLLRAKGLREIGLVGRRRRSPMSPFTPRAGASGSSYHPDRLLATLPVIPVV